MVDSRTCNTADLLAGVAAASANTSTEGRGSITWPCQQIKHTYQYMHYSYACRDYSGNKLNIEI